MSVQNTKNGYKPVKVGVKLPNGATYWLTPKSRKALKAEVDTLAKKIAVDPSALRKALFAAIKNEGMEFPSDHNVQDTVATKAARKQRRTEAMDVALFVQSLPGTDSLEGYNLALASFMEANDEGNHATAKTIQVANSRDGVDYPVMSADLSDFIEMRKCGGQYTKAIEASRKQRLKLAQERKAHSAARRAKSRRVSRRLKSFLERLSRGLVQPKARTQSRALELSTSTLSTHYRRARRMASKACKAVMAKIDAVIDHCELPSEATRSTQRLIGFDWVGSKVSVDRFKDRLATLLCDYYKERKENVGVKVNAPRTIQAQLAWGKGYWNRVTQPLTINLGSLVAKACK